MLINCPICGAENLDTTITCTACGCALISLNSVGYQLPSGTLLYQGKYRIEKTLGEGGFGITYKATDLENFTDVAIKELCPDKFLRHGINIIWPPSIPPKIQQEQIQKFKTEAESLKKCVHPNIVRVINWFEANNTAYLVMEFVSGKSLSKILTERGKLPENIVKKYFIQITEALKLVHANNFLHRDIKPDNIIINSQDQAILIDFGSAREFLAGLTNKMTAMLTPGYSPIEQYTNLGKSNPSTDLYAICASIYHVLTGRVPVAAPARLGSETLIFPRQIEPSIPIQIEQIILTGMK
ncbi:serine/threonine protein kinase, partial [Hydrocoleum sp. CS-953]|uniref:serine/threonine protein kinase n=1 Tax=Hydrocoleum sp. CS-953 TaxID=1671698 RepID=UPI000BC5825D